MTTTSYLAKNFSQLKLDKAFNYRTLVLLNAQTMADTDLLLSTSLCDFDRVLLTGPVTNQDVLRPSALLRMAKLAPQQGLRLLKMSKKPKACEVSELSVTIPDTTQGIQTNDQGLSFSIGLAEYAVALFMRTVLEQKVQQEDSTLVTTILVPNSLQRDLTREVYAKKRSVSSLFARCEP